jgi:hypothetical protein
MCEYFTLSPPPGRNPQPFLRNLNYQIAFTGDKSPDYFRIIPPGCAKNQTVASPTFNRTRELEIGSEQGCFPEQGR